MTAEEHQLILAMFAQQLHAISAVVEMLESRGLIDHDDFAAFHAASTSGGAPLSLLAGLTKAYVELGKQLGVEMPPSISLPTSPTAEG